MKHSCLKNMLENMSLKDSYLDDPNWEPSLSIWHKIWCPFCEAPNWFSGDAKYDIDGVDCWECRHLFWVISKSHRRDCYEYHLEPKFDEDKAEFECYDDVLRDAANTVQGQKAPR
jgi:hypothetical protein